MRLQLSTNELAQIINGKIIQLNESVIDVVVYDSRKIGTNRNAAFFALKGLHKHGHTFCQDAYDKGVRCFIVETPIQLPEDAHVILVNDSLYALQELALHHRNKFSIPVLAITGSFGKTTVKEWLYFVLKDSYKIGRTPKSFNSQLGVALSLLELSDEHELAIIEADISEPNEMDRLEEMISPTLGLFTGLGNHYAENFSDQKSHLNEHLKLFKHCNFTFILESYASPFRRNKINTITTSPQKWNNIPSIQDSFPENRALCFEVAAFFGIEETELIEKSAKLISLSGRQEVFEGQNGNLIINDTYNIDIDALEQALEYQFSSKEKGKKIVVLDLTHVNEKRKEEIIELVNRYQPDGFFLVENNTLPNELFEATNAIILFKGSFSSCLSELVQQLKNRKHETWVEFDLRAIQQNLRYFQELIPANTKALVMVKASSYGSGDMKIPHFLQENGVDYLGVAYTDEGVTLRENGIHLPILVMNTELNAYEDIIRFQLEPAIYSIGHLEAFIDFIQQKELTNFPIHLKLETGMNRLGISKDNVAKVIEMLRKTEAVHLKSVFSHLADADNNDQQYSLKQINQFIAVKTEFEQQFSNDKRPLFHILNSEGIINFSKIAAFDMVRIGIGLFGFASNTQGLMESIKWFTTVSQVKTISAGDFIGYGCSFQAQKDMKIATIRIGYADGFRRSLSNGVGKVFIHNNPCKIIGKVCMDMTMVDVTDLDIQEGDEVEIIGKNQTMSDFAKLLDTIPYEVMTSINKRVARIYVKR